MDDKSEINEETDNDENVSVVDNTNEDIIVVEEKEPEEKSLDESIISKCISMLCKTSDGLNYAYVQLYCTKKLLTDISILSRYIHLRYIDLSNNEISDISSLHGLNDLLVLDCSSNRITHIASMDLPYLQRLNLSNNRIERLETITFPQLECLNLNGNKLTTLYSVVNEVTLQSELLPSLTTLELRGNLLTDTTGLEALHTLSTLYLSKNKISKIVDLENLRNLQTLHLRDNQITTLDGFAGDLSSLQYLNLRSNNIDDLSEIKKLQDLSLLRALILSGNQIAEKDEYRLETLTVLRKLVRLDKDNFLDEERTEAEQIYEQRLQEEMLEREKSIADEDNVEE